MNAAVRLATLVLLVCCLAAAPASRPVKTGALTLIFTERAAASGIDTMGQRMGWSKRILEKTSKAADYDLAKESFQAYVPGDYEGAKAFGLLVYVSPGDTGAIPVKGWQAVLDKRHLIWISPNKAGNERPIWCRMGLAIDAAVGMAQRYRIDPDRVYVAGLSGGGRTASMLAVCFPERFAGGLYLCGCNCWRDVASAERPDRYFRRGFVAPPDRILEQAKERHHVLLTGQTDQNREQTKVYADAWKKDGFRHVTYIEVPAMGHEAPDERWFAKAVEAMDAGK